MPSNTHRIIATLLAKKIRNEGYHVVCFDDNPKDVSDLKLYMPPKIVRHRPDVVGVDPESGNLIIGEAKSSKDLSSKRTKEQLLDFSKSKINDSESIRLIVGIPLSCEKKLEKILSQQGLLDRKNIDILKIPDRLLPNEKK